MTKAVALHSTTRSKSRIQIYCFFIWNRRTRNGIQNADPKYKAITMANLRWFLMSNGRFCGSGKQTNFRRLANSSIQNIGLTLPLYETWCPPLFLTACRMAALGTRASREAIMMLMSVRPVVELLRPVVASSFEQMAPQSLHATAGKTRSEIRFCFWSLGS